MLGEVARFCLSGHYCQPVSTPFSDILAGLVGLLLESLGNLSLFWCSVSCLIRMVRLSRGGVVRKWLVDAARVSKLKDEPYAV